MPAERPQLPVRRADTESADDHRVGVRPRGGGGDRRMVKNGEKLRKKRCVPVPRLPQAAAIEKAPDPFPRRSTAADAVANQPPAENKS
ncbi:MAG: hypothetical protein GTO62_20045 [Planctomycetales bacterium]|nr:hypothetical protein [Planctomycetales bacterium]NIP71469.1 hypothetical protein [Planctomycetales bacterium]